MGTFTNMFGAASGVNEKIPDTISSSQSQFPVCKFCGGDLIVVRANFDADSRGSDKSINCKECGRNQAGK